MPYELKGTLKAPNGTPLVGVDIKFIAQQTFSPLLQQVDTVIRTTQSGGYDLSLEFNTYTVMATVNNCGQVCMGAISVFSDTSAGQDLPTLLQKTDWQPATPDYIKQIEGWLAESNRLNNQGIASAAAAKASEIAVEADRAEVASNKTIVLNAQSDVTNKQAQVSASAAAAASSASSASASAATASQKEALATSAANTASQKASLAAGSEASASDSARRAEEAAQAVSSALIDGGSANLSSGTYPPPVSVGGVKRSTFWKVTAGGVVSGVDYGAGDTLIYTTTGGGSYYKIDNTESVSKVNEKTGVVVLNAADVGAEDRGTAAPLVTQHATKTGAHPIGGVSGLQAELDSKYSPSNKPTAADVGADVSGAASTLINQHVAAPDPHTQYANKASMESRLAAIEALIDKAGFPKTFVSRAQLAIVSALYHPLDGQLVNRSTDAGLLAKIQSGELPSCSDADWLADKYKRGMYTLGNGTTTIRLPDWNGKFSGSEGAVALRGDGKNADSVGIIQGDRIRNISGRVGMGSAGTFAQVLIDGREAFYTDDTQFPSGNGDAIPPGSVSQPGRCNTLNLDASRVVPTGPDVAMLNTAVVWSVKR